MSCQSCQQKRGLVQTVTHGAVGLAKFATGIGLAPSRVISDRRMICQGCDQNKLGFCALCKCNLTAKTSLVQETCPAEKW